jgi:uncharacterized protein
MRPPGRRGRSVASEPFAVLLISGTHERAHYAFILATAAAAIGRPVTLFATNGGCRALLADWSGLDDAERDARIRAEGVGGLDALREAAIELDVTLIACEAGLRAERLDPAGLLPGVTVAGVVTLLNRAGSGQIVTI